MNAIVAENPRVVIGGNNPPDPFAAISVHVSDLMTEARHWADGAAIESQEQADEVARLIEEFRKAAKAADDARKEEARPHDEAKAAIQEKYGELIAETKTRTGAIPRALAALKATLTPWLQKLEQERQARERAAREEAERKAREAAEAMRLANASDLEAREAAEAKVLDAKAAESAANAAAREKAHARGDGRAIGLRKTYRAVITDRKAALIHYAWTQPEALTGVLQQLADRDVREGKRQIPGVEVREEATL